MNLPMMLMLMIMVMMMIIMTMMMTTMTTMMIQIHFVNNLMRQQKTSDQHAQYWQKNNM